jgi:hypothetical protein
MFVAEEIGIGALPPLPARPCDPHRPPHPSGCLLGRSEGFAFRQSRPPHQPSSPAVLNPSRASQHAGFPATPIPSCVYFITCGHPGWGSHLSNQRSHPCQGSAMPSPFPATRWNTPSGTGPKVPAMSEGICFSFTSSFHFFSPSRITRHGTPATLHSPLPTNLSRIRTCEKSARNPFRMRTSETHDLKLFRMNTYEKTPGGGSPSFTSLISFKTPIWRLAFPGVGRGRNRNGGGCDRRG